MYDTTNIKLEIESLKPNRAYTLEDIKNSLGVELVKKPQSKNEYENETYLGFCKNFRVVLTNQGLFLYGSLCKYHFGNNYRTLKRHDVKEAIEALSFEIKAPLKNALVRRLDFGINTEVNLPAQLYLTSIEFQRKRTTARRGDSVYYHYSSKKLGIYDKYKEMKKKHLLSESTPKNLLRYEISLERVKQFFGNEPILFEDLCKKEVYDQCLKLWVKDLLKIKAGLSTSISLVDFSNIKELRSQLLLIGIEKTGGLSEVLNSVDLSWKAGLIKSKHQHSYCKASLIKDYSTFVSDKKSLDLKGRLVKELKRNFIKNAFLHSN